MVCFDSLMIILGHNYVTILLAKMLIWALFLQSMCTFYFCINPCLYTLLAAGLELGTFNFRAQVADY